jgi:hypothetical protein
MHFLTWVKHARRGFTLDFYRRIQNPSNFLPEARMTPSLNSQSFKPAPSALRLDDNVRELVAAMPIVIFANAIRDVLLRRRSNRAAPVATPTSRSR